MTSLTESMIEAQVSKTDEGRKLVLAHKSQLYFDKMDKLLVLIRKSRTLNQRTIDLANDIMFGQAEVDDFKTSKVPHKRIIYEKLQKRVNYNTYGDALINSIFNNTKEMYEKFEKYEYRAKNFVKVLKIKLACPACLTKFYEFKKLFDSNLEDEDEYMMGVATDDPFLTQQERDEPDYIMFLSHKRINESMRNMIELNIKLTTAVERIEDFTELVEDLIKAEEEAREKVGYGIQEKSFTLTNEETRQEIEARKITINSINYMIDDEGQYYFDVGFDRIEEKDWHPVKNPVNNDYIYDRDIKESIPEEERYRRSW